MTLIANENSLALRSRHGNRVEKRWYKIVNTWRSWKNKTKISAFVFVLENPLLSNTLFSFNPLIRYLFVIQKRKTVRPNVFSETKAKKGSLSEDVLLNLFWSFINMAILGLDSYFWGWIKCDIIIMKEITRLSERSLTQEGAIQGGTL